MKKYRIRILKENDDGSIRRIVHETKLISEPSLNRLLDEMIYSKLPDRECLVYETEQIDGFLFFKKDILCSDTWIIYVLAVSPPKQRNGIGSKLLKTSLERMISHFNARIIIVESSINFVPAHRLYKNFGFKQVAIVDNYFSAGEAKLIFTKHQ